MLELLLKKKLNQRPSVQNNQLNSNWEEVKDSLDKNSRLHREQNGTRQDRNAEVSRKTEGRSTGSSRISETVSTVTTPRKRAVSISVEHEEDMKQTWLKTN